MTLPSHHHSIMILYVHLCFICSIHFHDIIITYPSNLYISFSVSNPPILPSLLYLPPLRQNSTHACDGSAHRDEDCPPNINATGGPRREDLIWWHCMTFGVSPIVWRFAVWPHIDKFPYTTSYHVFLLKQISRLKHLTSYSLIPQSSALPGVKGILAVIHFNFCFLTFFFDWDVSRNFA